MSPTLLARVDGLPVMLLERERIFPAPSTPSNGSSASRRRRRSALRRARIERQTAAVHTAVAPHSIRAKLGFEPVVGAPYLMFEDDRAGIVAELAQAGIL